MFKNIKHLVLAAALVFGLSAGVMAVSMPSVDTLWNANGSYIGSLGAKIMSARAGSVVPTMGTCGTATVSGTDSAMKVIITAGTPSACTVNFGSAWLTAPVCTMVDETTAAGSTSKLLASTTVVTATIAAGNYGTDTIDILCTGRAS